MQGPLSLKNKMLSTPLLNISKASTPVRTRIISSNNVMNSTPINQLKFTTTVSRSPVSKYHNKQKQNNMNGANNYYNEFIKKQVEQQKYQRQNLSINLSQTIKSGKQQFMSKANLSPIFQLNRKMNQGPLSFKQSNINKQSFRSLTPNSSYYQLFQDNHNNLNQSNISLKNYKSQKVSDRYNQPLQYNNNNINNNNINSNLRQSRQNNKIMKGSNSFSNLFEIKGNNNNMKQSRNKIPSRLGSMVFSSLNKQNNMMDSKLRLGILRDSNIFVLSQLANKQNNNEQRLRVDREQNSFIKMSQSKKSLINSKSFDKKCEIQQFSSPKHFINQDNQSQIILTCVNHLNKKAKYRVLNQQIVYCSKCAMQVVQRGVSVEELQNYQHFISHNSNNRMCQNFTQFNPSTKVNQNYNQASSFKNKFQAFKPSSEINYMLNQCSNLIQELKAKINHQIFILSTNKQTIQKSYTESIFQVDNYYNSLIEYIQNQRQKDKSQIQNLKLRGFKGNQEMKYNQFMNQLEYMMDFIRKKNVNANNSGQFLRELQQIHQQIDKQIRQNYQEKFDQNKKLLNISQPIQNQLDQFVHIFDEYLKFKYILANNLTSQTYQINKKTVNNINQNSKLKINHVQQNVRRLPQQNNGLRFSFQKALQSQNNKKKYILQSNMKPLQQQSEQQQSQQQNSSNNNNCDWNYSRNQIISAQSQQNYYEQRLNQVRKNDQNGFYTKQNSFNYDSIENMANSNKISEINNKNYIYKNDKQRQIHNQIDQQQKPFRTLFVSDDEILCQNQNFIRNDNAQNRCTVIDLGIDQDQQYQYSYQSKKNIQSPVFKTR